MGVGGDVEVRVVRRGGDEGVDVRECPVTRGWVGNGIQELIRVTAAQPAEAPVCLYGGKGRIVRGSS